MSALITFEKASAGGAEQTFHCGTPMELVTPAVGRAAMGYSFDPDEFVPVKLPPVWRCQCGFQLDAWAPCGGSIQASR
ncbi:hypothetical protein [Pseudarthrobacter chlorophenolicus]|uniref:hypothetical protein n=1 Tax=Pseudarthrobacter chlorophenolicus TaxID=85085 RepID=UPI0009E1CEAC|nr:hypothetical protein [Pseudarthrobacter chlorophenolicus]